MSAPDQITANCCTAVSGVPGQNRPRNYTADKAASEGKQPYRRTLDSSHQSERVERLELFTGNENRWLRRKRSPPMPNGKPGTRGLEVGQQDAFTPAQLKRIRQVLTHREVPGLRDLALFSVAIDTMLRGQDLLDLAVKDVQLRNGTVLSVIKVARTTRKPPVRCALSEATVNLKREG
jgi:integrase